MMNGPNFRKSTKIVLFSVKMNHISEKITYEKMFKDMLFFGWAKICLCHSFYKISY